MSPIAAGILWRTASGKRSNLEIKETAGRERNNVLPHDLMRESHCFEISGEIVCFPPLSLHEMRQRINLRGRMLLGEKLLDNSGHEHAITSAR